MKKKENPTLQVQESSESGENQELKNNTEDQSQENDSSGVDKGQENDSSSEDQGQDEVRKVLTALYPILYLSHQYKVGDELPANDPGMVEAWIRAGTATWIQPAGESPKAKPRTAEPGLSGQAVLSEAEDGDDLAGKVPITFGRKGQA